MKAVILPENIINYLPLINKVLPSHSQVPILSSILLQASENGFFIRATDFEIGVEIKIPAKIDTEGKVAIPGKEFLEVINSFPKDKIEISLVQDSLTIKCRENKVTFNTIPTEEFPALFKTKGDEVVSFKREEFFDIFSYLSFSVAQDESRPQLTGVLLDTKDNGVDFVATDGYRMSVKKMNKKLKNLTDPIIISAKLINEILSLRDTSDIRIFVNKAENQIIFEIGVVVLVGRMIEGKFPDYEKVLPKEALATIVLERDSLLQNVKLASVFAKDTSNVVKIEVKDDFLKLLSRTQGVGEGEFVSECKKEGEDVSVSLNVRYLHDLLKNISEKELTLKLNSPSEPAVFEIKKKEFLHVIMPVQVEG